MAKKELKTSQRLPQPELPETKQRRPKREKLESRKLLSTHILDISNVDITNTPVTIQNFTDELQIPVPPLSPSPKKFPSSDAYDQLSTTLDAEQHAFRQQLAAKLAPALNALAREMPHGTYEEKKELARWVNEELRRFDLAIKCPKTGEPSMVMATPGYQPEIGRFSIEHKTAEGKRVRSVNTVELPEFELMESAPRREALKEWQDRVKRGDSGASRA